jgi:Chitobiase/beta-hexosaminidase C-terminal domain/Legume lectin domain
MSKRLLGALMVMSAVSWTVANTDAAGATPPSVTTWRYDIGRTGQNQNETSLTPSNVNSSSFGKLYSYVVDGYVYAQPLYLPGLVISGQAHNVLFIATQHDSVYAFDADHSQQLWQASLIDTAHGAPSGATTVPSTDIASSDIVPEIGITGTPVIDPTSNTLYVAAKSKESGNYVYRLHALDVRTGNEKSGSPVVIQPQVPGNGIGSVSGEVSFDTQWELQRTGLLLMDGNVFVGFGAHGDNGPYHGWLVSYNAATLAQVAVFNSSPNGKGNGIWQSGEGLAADVVNGVPRLFIVTGNFFKTGAAVSYPTAPYTDAENYSNAIVRFDITGGGLVISDQWTPFDSDTLSSGDKDQTSGGALLLPDQTGANVHELVQVGKNGRIEVLDRDDLGGFNTSSNLVVQEITGQVSGLWSTPAYWNGMVYFWGSGDYLKQFSLSSGLLSQTPLVTGKVKSQFPGTSPVVSSNGTSNGILWGIRSDGYSASTPAILYAYNATNIGTMLYASTQNAARDAAGTAVKMAVPVVVNGKVYVGAQGEVDVYGLLAAATPDAPAPTFSPAAGVYASAQKVQLSDTLSGAAIYYTTDGTPPTTSSALYTGAIAVNSSTTLEAIAVATGYNESSLSSATYTIGSAPTINFSNGFASVVGLTLNGSAVNSDDSRLQLTTGGTDQSGSFFWNTPVNIQSFVTDFQFQLSGSPPLADGITFTVQADAATALGLLGGGLGYGPDYVGGKGGIPNSMAVKFDVYNNAGEGADSTGLYVNGASPTIPAVDLTSSGISLSSGDVIGGHLAYDGTMLYLTLKDVVAAKTYATRFPIALPQTIGANAAYAGFTGGTGGFTSSQKILGWTLTSQPSFPYVQYATKSLPAQSSGPDFRTFGWSGLPDKTGTILDATQAGDSVTFTVNVAQPGTYDLHVSAKTYNSRGIWQLSVDGVNVGTPVDEYNPGETYANYDLGPLVIGAAGNHSFTFTVTGRDATSTGFSIAFDDLRLDTR